MGVFTKAKDICLHGTAEAGPKTVSHPEEGATSKTFFSQNRKPMNVLST